MREIGGFEARTGEIGGFEARLRGTSEQDTLLLRVIGLTSAPAASGIHVSTVMATVIDAMVHQLQLHEVDLDRDD